MELQQKSEESAFTLKKSAKYALLPGVFPRLSRLGHAFGSILFIFTQLFGVIGLIDKDHPCLRAENMHNYRFTDVLGYAMRNLSFTRKGIPQVLMFFAVIAAIVLLLAIVVITFVQVAFPMATAHAQYFGTPTGGGGVAYGGVLNDWVYRFLNRVFGGELFTGKEIAEGAAAGTGVGGTGFSGLLSNMLRGYSLALLVIAVFMVLYILIVAAVESAKTGQPFGSRFDGAWAPIRLALGIGLLIPISAQGYNGAQMVAFQAAEWGSNLATNVWFGAIENAGKNAQLFEGPQPDPGYKFVHDYFMLHLCKEALKKIDDLSDVPADDDADWVTPAKTDKYIQYSIGTQPDPDLCGVVRVPNPASYLTSVSIPQQIRGGGAFPQKIISVYESIPTALNGPMAAIAAQAAAQDLDEKELGLNEIITPGEVKKWVDIYWRSLGGVVNPGGYPRFYNGWGPSYDPVNKWFMESLAQDAKFGWATAGVFYLRLSKVQEIMQNVVAESPVVTSRFETILDDPAAMGALTAMATVAALNPVTAVGAMIYVSYKLPSKSEIKLDHLLKEASKVIADAPSIQPGPGVPQAWSDASENLRIQVGGTQTWKNALAGQEDADQLADVPVEGIIGSFSNWMLEKIKISNNDLNPMSTVVTYGSNLMGASVAAFGLAAVVSYISPATGSILVTLGELMLLAGFALAVVIPFMPFLYFMFAVIEWVISVLEAVIGMPLFALSFITLEGDVLGKAFEGVMKLFEIVLRPAVIIMSLIASMLIFMASVAFVNDAFQLYRTAQVSTTSLTSGDFTNGVTSLAQIIIYMFLMYILANSSFKLIDAIPNNFMRWIGGPAGFGSMTKFGAVDELSKYAGGAYLYGKVKNATGGKPWFKNPLPPQQPPQPPQPKPGGGGAGGGAGGGQGSNAQANYMGGPGAAGGGGGPSALLGGPTTGGAGRSGRGTGGPNSKFDKGQGQYVDFEES